MCVCGGGFAHDNIYNPKLFILSLKNISKGENAHFRTQFLTPAYGERRSVPKIPVYSLACLEVGCLAGKSGSFLPPHPLLTSHHPGWGLCHTQERPPQPEQVYSETLGSAFGKRKREPLFACSWNHITFLSETFTFTSASLSLQKIEESVPSARTMEEPRKISRAAGPENTAGAPFLLKKKKSLTVREKNFNQNGK